jgi:transposase
VSWDDQSGNPRTDSPLFFAEHWKIGTIAQALNVHPDTVQRAIEVELFHQAAPLRPSIVDPYLPFVRQVLEQHPWLRATRIYQMIRDRGYSGSVEQLRRIVARLRPQPHEAFLRLQVFPAEQAQVDGPTSAPSWSFSCWSALSQDKGRAFAPRPAHRPR